MQATRNPVRRSAAPAVNWFEKAFRSPPAPRPRAAAVPAPTKKLSRRLSAAALESAEDALFEALLDNHPNRDRALDRLLDDVAATPAARREPALRLVPQFTPERLVLIEELLVGAVLDSHPRRDEALDRLLDDLAGHRLHRADEERERAAYDMTCDNDFDGLG